MPVGNDVVDLRDPENQPEAIHARFDERVFGPAEREEIRASYAPHRMRWALWAAKESAYKVARRLNPRVPFHPRSFSVRLIDVTPGTDQPVRAEVRHPGDLFRVDFRHTHDWVHAVARLPERSVESVRWEIDSLPAAAGRAPDVRQASEYVRRLARSALASTLCLLPSDLVIAAAAARRAPRVWWRGRALPLDLSLSHHGRFVACAWGQPASK